MTGSELFTLSRKGKYWNDLYERPSSFFDHTMVQRRDYATRYICSHCDRGSKVLDLGCGAAVLSEKLIENGLTVTAADGSQDMLSLARDRLRRFPGGAYGLLHADCMDLPFRDAEFDLVACLGVFGYFDGVSRALSEIRRVLRPGGTLIISVRNAHTKYLVDPFEVLKLPYRATRALGRHFMGRPRKSPSSTISADKANQLQDGFRIQIYENPLHLIRGVTRRGYSLTRFDGLGYGPVAFARKKLLSEQASIRLSNCLESVFRSTGFNKVSRWVADVSFYIFQRDR